MADGPIISIEHLEKRFSGKNADVFALRGIDLAIGRGDIFGIIGKSGAGKSTLVRCINMLERPTAGSVFFEGRDLCRLPEAALRKARRSMGMIFQQFNLLMQRTALQNVCFPLELTGAPRDETRKRAEELLDMVGLANRMDSYPSQLSGGQKQRVGIARAIVSNPSVLLSDEATSALDPETVKSILQLLKDINKKMGITIIMITHQMEVIKEIAEQVAVIEKGKIIEQGSVVDLFTNPQTETLKKFVGSVMSSDVPEQLSHMHISKEKKAESDQTIISLKFRGDVANEPIIANLIRKYNLDVSILYGSIDYIQNVSFGRLIIMINGHEDDMKKALGHLQSLPITSEVIGYVPSDN